MSDTIYKHNPYAILSGNPIDDSDNNAGNNMSNNVGNNIDKKSSISRQSSHHNQVKHTGHSIRESKQSSFKKHLGISYEDRIMLIREYFGISELCAIYLYHRRRRGVPWYRPSDPKYLEWSVELQNALICLDTVTGFDWRGLEFGYEEIHFIRNNIDMLQMPNKVVVLSEVKSTYLRNLPDKDGFIKVEHNKINITRELNKMGLIPKNYCN